MKRSFPLRPMLSAQSRRLFILTSLLLGPTPLHAASITGLIGPPSFGQGGSNPLSIPPTNIIDWQASYRTDQGREWTLSIIPGLYYGQRFTNDRFSVGLGGGILVGTNGLGLGLYSSLGYMTDVFWKKYHFEAEYRQVIGYASKGAEFPYSFRMGLTYDL